MLAAYSQRSLKNPPKISDTKASREVTGAVEKAYAIEAEVAHTFDLSKLETIFINDPRFPLDPALSQTLEEFTGSPSNETAGYLDYKLTYYTWRKDATLHAEAVYEKAKLEKRDLNEDEKIPF